MRYETKANFAKKAKVSRQAIYQLLKDGKLVAGHTGKLDVKNELNAEYLSMKGEIKAEPVKSKDKKSTTPGQSINLDYSPKNLNSISRESANKLKIIESIRKIQIANDAARLELISRDSVKMVFSKLYQIDINQLRTLGPSLAPEIAAIVGSDDPEVMLKISDSIEKEVFTILKQIKRLLNDFLTGIRADEIE